MKNIKDGHCMMTTRNPQQPQLYGSKATINTRLKQPFTSCDAIKYMYSCNKNYQVIIEK